MTLRRIATMLVALALCACSAHETKTAERSVSPLIGTWTRDGDVPKPDANNPEFTKLTFSSDGKLAAQYVAAGGALAGVIGKAPKIQNEGDTYTTTASELRVSEGTSYRGFQFHVTDGKLYLTPDGGSDAATFTKADGG